MAEFPQLKPRQVVPTRNPVGGGERRFVQSALLFTNGAAGLHIVTAPATVMVDVSIPSARLSVGLAFTFDPDNADDAPFPTSGPTAWQAAIVAWVNLDNERHGRVTRANTIMATTPVPTMWEVESTTVRKWRGTVVIPNPAGVASGRLYATAYWEPAPGESNMTDEELHNLFSSCTCTPVIGGVGSVS